MNIKQDLRRYSRVNIHTMCTFYALRKFELPAIVLNISEAGVLIELEYNDELFISLKENDTVLFQGIDLDINLNNASDDDCKRIFQERALVKRIETKNDKLRIACEVSGWDKYYRNYVKLLKSNCENQE